MATLRIEKAKDRLLLFSPQSKKRVNHVETQAKKRRIDELNFQAANVREDLKESGIQCLPGLFGRSRALPVGSVDMSSVKLVVRSKGQPCHEATSSKLPADQVPCTNTYSDLLYACQSFYKINGPITDVNADVYHDRAPSATSTITTSESVTSTSDGDSDLELIIPARLKERTSKEKASVVKKEQNELNLEPLSSPCLSLEDALHNKESATLIVGARFPHAIIHVNAAFSKLTGISSEELIGRKATNFLKNNDSIESTISLLSKPEPKNGVIEDLPALFKPVMHQVLPVSSNDNGVLTHMSLSFDRIDSSGTSISVVG